jgi:putative ABC transport system substrate-binding protein
MRRREFITLFGGAAASWPLSARAQQQMPVVGYLDATSALSNIDPNIQTFRQGLSEAGFIEGKNVAIEYRSANGQYERLPELAADLVHRQVTVITANSPVVALAAKAATTMIPIVFSLGSDPVKDGLVANLYRPGGNITGVTFFANVLLAKRLDLLHELLPNAAVIAVLLNPNNTSAERDLNEIQIAAHVLGVQLVVLRAGTESEIDTALLNIVQQGASALFVSADAFFNTLGRNRILVLAARHAVPVSFAIRSAAEAGALMSYGARLSEVYRQFGLYTGRILKGEKPAEMPVQQPTKFEFLLNLKTAKTLGLTVPASLLAIADEVIE